jgi:hypothetical protein
MAVTKPRNRTLIFRLTQEEYESVRAASSASRSLSDFAREALLTSIDAVPLSAQLSQLSSNVARLAELLEKR